MREIKFRAWNKETKIIIMNIQNMYDHLGEWFDNHGKKIDSYDHMSGSSFRGVLNDEDLIIMQYTGLHDSKEVEIYEGDIVNYESISPNGKSGQGEVYFEDCGCFCSFMIREGNTAITMGSMVYKIIGNIYENPELLENKN